MLKELRGATERKWPYVRKCRGSTIGVDLFIWLHQEIMNFFRDVVEHGATSPDYSSVLAAIKERVVRYVISGVRLFFVIDGRRLPGKYGTDGRSGRVRPRESGRLDPHPPEQSQALVAAWCRKPYAHAGRLDVHADARPHHCSARTALRPLASSPNDVRASHSKRVTRLWRGGGHRRALDHLAQGGKPGQPIGEAFLAPILKSFIAQAAILARGAEN